MIEKEPETSKKMIQAVIDQLRGGMDGIEATKYIVENDLGKVLILTTFDDDELVQNALRNGAKGYLIKNHTPEHLKQMIKSVYNGTGVMEDAILENLVKENLSHRTALAVYYLTGKKQG